MTGKSCAHLFALAWLKKGPKHQLNNCLQKRTISMQIQWEDLAPTLVKKLGSGSFGQVYEAYWHSAPAAVKIMTLVRLLVL